MKKKFFPWSAKENPIKLIVFFLGILFLISGCARTKPTKMPLRNGISQFKFDDKGIVVMNLKISNAYRPSYQPKVYSIKTSLISEMGEINSKIFQVNEAYVSLEDKFNKYLISFELPLGYYKVMEIRGGSGIFPISGHFEFPLNVKFEVSSNKITYIGNIEMVNRKKEKGEIVSGSAFPIIDQVATGFGNGTFDIKISDNFIEDKKMIYEKFPFIVNHKIIKNIAKL